MIEPATLGAGCFWCVEAIYKELDGVVDIEPGYAGGMKENPTYEEVCTGTTGHAEVCHLKFDPNIISYNRILEVFWRTHDPTTLNRQGGDVGTQYRSVIFYHNEEQRKLAEASKKLMADSGIWNDPIVTEITAINNYYPAEDYHKDYFARNPAKPYCAAVIGPKVEKFKKLLRELESG